MSHEITQRISFGSSLAGTPFTVERVVPEITPTRELEICSRAIRTITYKSWSSKLTADESVDHEAIEGVIPTPLEQLNRMTAPKNNARYWLTRSGGFMGEGITDIDEVLGYLRVEEYKPKNPLKKAYPNITDFEGKSGYITGSFEKQAAALLYFSLGEFQGERKVASYELEGSDGIEFYEEHGFGQTGNRPTMDVGESKVVTVHLEAPSVAHVRASLMQNYPWLDVSDML